jgi:hypothetical protein
MFLVYDSGDAALLFYGKRGLRTVVHHSSILFNTTAEGRSDPGS